jgi:hypothetical protein
MLINWFVIYMSRLVFALILEKVCFIFFKI